MGSGASGSGSTSTVPSSPAIACAELVKSIRSSWIVQRQTPGTTSSALSATVVGSLPGVIVGSRATRRPLGRGRAALARERPPGGRLVRPRQRRRERLRRLAARPRRPGQVATPAHAEGAEEEIFSVLSGSGISWQDGEAYQIGAGECLVQLPEEQAHTLRGGAEASRCSPTVSASRRATRSFLVRASPG
jgi:mannose-6-phosphate isomerase-like protein (cupin superfamily)